MGQIYQYRCHDCRKKVSFRLGCGMMYPSICRETEEAIASGELGQRLKDAFESCEFPLVCPCNQMYLCPDCGHWEVFRDYSVYSPADIETAKASFEETGRKPFVLDWEVEEGKIICVGSYSPECPECGSEMHLSPKNKKGNLDANFLRCPRCESTNASVNPIGYYD